MQLKPVMINNVLELSQIEFIVAANHIYHLKFQVCWFVAVSLWECNGNGLIMTNYIICSKSIFYDYSVFSSTCWIYRAYISFSMYDCMINRLYHRSKTYNFSFGNNHQTTTFIKLNLSRIHLFMYLFNIQNIKCLIFFYIVYYLFQF